MVLIYKFAVPCLAIAPAFIAFIAPAFIALPLPLVLLFSCPCLALHPGRPLLESIQRLTPEPEPPGHKKTRLWGRVGKVGLLS